MTTHSTSMRRLGLALATALVSGLALVAVGAAPATAGPVAGERSTISGTAAGKVKRPVKLQKYQSRAWRTVSKARTTSKGRYSFSVTTPSSRTSYRVYAPKARIKTHGRTRTYRSWKSSTRRIAPTVQSASFTTPDRVHKGETITATATFRPARAGRPVVLQRYDGTAWRTVAAGKQDSSGRTSLALGAVESGALRLRAQTTAYRGAVAYTSPVRTVVVEDRTVLLSRGTDGLPGDRASSWPSLSRDGRWEVFESAARNLVPQETTHFQIYLRDHLTGHVRLISATDGGVPSDGYNYEPKISADGSTIVWSSEASNLEQEDNGDRDIFRWTRDDDKVRRISQLPDGSSSAHHSSAPSVSDNGMTVAYLSGSTRLVPGIEDRNLRDDVFVWSANGDRTEIVSLRDGSKVTGNEGATRPSISGNGQVVAFGSRASDLVTGDTNKVEDLFVYYRSTNALQMLTRSPLGAPADGESTAPALDEDGSTIAFISRAGNLTSPATTGFSRLMVWTREDDRFRAYAGTNFNASVSADGERIAFTSGQPQVPTDRNGEPDVYLLDLTDGTTTLVSVTPTGESGNGRSENGVISRDGKHVAFTSGASTLIGEEPRGVTQTYARDLG